MAQTEKCLSCGRWHPDIIFSGLLDAWIGKGCLLGIIERDHENDVARLAAEELGLNFSELLPRETVCDFCGGDDAKIFDEIEGKKICLTCWNKVKP